MRAYVFYGLSDDGMCYLSDVSVNNINKWTFNESQMFQLPLAGKISRLFGYDMK